MLAIFCIYESSETKLNQSDIEEPVKHSDRIFKSKYSPLQQYATYHSAP